MLAVVMGAPASSMASPAGAQLDGSDGSRSRQHARRDLDHADVWAGGCVVLSVCVLGPVVVVWLVRCGVSCVIVGWLMLLVSFVLLLLLLEWFPGG